MPGEPFTTHVLNVLHLLLPAGEDFFVDVFKKTLPLIKDDQLRLDVQGFIGQEAMHSQTHSGVLDYFAANGIDLTPFTGQIEWLFGKLMGDRPGGVSGGSTVGCSNRCRSSRRSSTTQRYSASGL